MEPSEASVKIELWLRMYRQMAVSYTHLDVYKRQKDDCAHLMTLEMGKPLKAAVAEAMKCASGCRYYAENAEKFLADEWIETGARRSFVRYLPSGPILAIMPWNFPFWQVMRFLAPALMAGNVGLLKHASNVPQCALKIEEMILRAGFAEGVFQTLLIGSGPVDGILNDPRVVAATPVSYTHLGHRPPWCARSSASSPSAPR